MVVVVVRGEALVRAGVALGLPFLWILLVPLGPVGAALAGPSGAVTFALGHGVALLALASADLGRLRQPLRWGGPVLAAVAVTLAALDGWVVVSGLAVAGGVAAVPVLAAAWELGRLDRGQRALAVAVGAGLANLPLVALGAWATAEAPRLAWLVAGLVAGLQPFAVRPGPVPVGAVSRRLAVSIGFAYLVGGVTYAVVLPALGGAGWGVAPYLAALLPAAVATRRLGADAVARLGIGALGLGVLIWALGTDKLGSAAATGMVAAWALLDVGLWTRLGEEPGWGRAYAAGLGAMVCGIGLGLLVTPLAQQLAGALAAPVVAAVALLGAAMLVPADPPGLVAREEAALAAQPGPGDAAPALPGSASVRALLRARYGLSAREAEALEMAMRGLANKEIAAEMGITVGTVRTHLERAYRKLGVEGRVEAAWRLFGDVGMPPGGERPRSRSGGR